MSKNSSLFAFVAGVAAGALLTAFARTEEGRKAKEAVKSYVKDGLKDIRIEVKDGDDEEEPEEWNDGDAGAADANGEDE